jgi:hypothetical protein
VKRKSSPQFKEFSVKSALFLLLGSTWLASCAIVQSASCRKAAQGDIPCQGLKGLEFQNCQLEVRRAVATCQTEQMHGNPDSVGVYRLPPPEASKAVAAPVVVAPVVAPENQDTVVVKTPDVKEAQPVAPTAPIAASVDSAAKSVLASIKIDSALPPASTSVPSLPVVSSTQQDSVATLKADTAKSPATPATSLKPAALTPQDSANADAAHKKSKKSKKSKKHDLENAAPSDTTAAPLVSEPAKPEPAPVDSAALAPVPEQAVDTSSVPATEPVKKKHHKKKS